ncbi:MAG: BadF/BadG/BcrA/BcrD ATPase family protein [Gemmatimonadales bacterium]
MIVVTADVGGTTTSVAVTRDGERLVTARGPGAPLRAGRALATATAVAQVMRSGLAQAGLLEADVVVVGAAGAGSQAAADELRGAFLPERLARRVVVVGDTTLAFAAMGVETGALLAAGTGSIAVGRTAKGDMVRRGGLGWQMGDEGGGYWIGRQALAAVGAAEDGRSPATALRAALLGARGTSEFRDLVAWSATAAPREVAALAKVVAAHGTDAVAARILTDAAGHLLGLVTSLAAEFGDQRAVPLGLAGSLLGPGSPMAAMVIDRIGEPFAVREAPVDALLGGPLIAAAP